MSHSHNPSLDRAHILLEKMRASPSSFSGFNDLLGLFYKGIPIEILGDILHHPNEHVILGALYIAEELGVKAGSVIKEVISHVHDRNPSIRAATYDAIGNITLDKNEAAFAYVVAGIRDEEPHCRNTVMLWMMRVSDKRLSMAMESPMIASGSGDIYRCMQMILGDFSRNEQKIKSWICDKDALIRKFGMIAAGRSAELYPNLLELAASSDDPELQTCATIQMRFISLRKRREK